MKKILRIIAIIILAASIYSLVPVLWLYVSKDPAPYTNKQAVEKLKDNKGDYFEFIVFGDNHSGLIFDDSATLKIVRSINREDRFRKIPIDLAIIAGDVSFRGSRWDYRTYNKIKSMIKMPVISAMGNHDDDKDDGTLFKKYAGEKEFAFANRNCYFIVIDNISGNMTEEQFAKLEEELTVSSFYTHRFIIMHKSPLSPYFQSWYRPELNPWSYRFMKLCEKYKVDIVFAGHEHMFMEKKLGGVRYIVTGGGGILQNIPDSDGGFLHYTAVRVYGDYIDYEVRKIFPPVWEYFTFYMWKDALYFFKNALS
ncbi:MAG: metallophosphoesterase [Candidatus Omnitrophica bacterium]|nr:metallophosphoesterase [Candidatus Omnitrophota bacterium]